MLSDLPQEASAIRSIARTILIIVAVGLCACGHSDPGTLSVQLTYPAASHAVEGAANRSLFPDARTLHNPVSASYSTDLSNRILIRVLGPGFNPIEAWFERSEKRGVIRGVPPGVRISVEVDEYDSSAALYGTDARLLGRGWTRGIALSAGEAKTVVVAMYAKGSIVTICGAQASGGQGDPGDSGDGGLSNAAKIKNPSAVKAGPDDSIYISSSANGKVKRIDRYGYISNFAGNGGFGAVAAGDVVGVDASSVPIGFVSDIDIDPSGNIYLFTYSNQIVKVTAAGTILNVVYDNGTINPAAWDWFNLAVVNDDLLYFVNYSDSRVYRILDFVQSDFVKNGMSDSLTEPFEKMHYPISGPSGITYASKNDSLIFADTGNNRIMELSLLDLGIRYLVADDAHGDSFSEGVAPLSMAPVKPRVVEYNPITGKIFFVEDNGSRILYISNDNVVRVFAGTEHLGFSGDDGPATEAQLYDPRGVTVDSHGNVYIADYGNHAIRMVVGGALP